MALTLGCIWKASGPRQRRWRPPLLLRRTKVLTLETMNQNIVNLQYAVRGPLVARALEIEAELAKVWRRAYWVHAGQSGMFTNVIVAGELQ